MKPMHNNQKKPEFYVQFIKQTGPQRFNLTIVHNRNLTVKITQRKTLHFTFKDLLVRHYLRFYKCTSVFYLVTDFKNIAD